MSCLFDIDINANPALEALKQYCGEHSSQFINYLTLVVDNLNETGTLTLSQDFLNEKGNENLDLVNSDKEVVKNSIINYFNKFFPDANNGVRDSKLTEKVKLFGYTSALARNEAKQWFVQQVIVSHHQLENENIEKALSSYINDAKGFVLYHLAERIAALTGEEFDDVFSDYFYDDEKQKIKDDEARDFINSIVESYGNKISRPLMNHIALAREILSNDNVEGSPNYFAEFLDELMLYKDINRINKEKETGEKLAEDIKTASEEAGDDPETTEDQAESDEVDDWLARLQNKLGLYTDYMTHIDSSIRSLLGTIPKLKTDELQNFKHVEDLDNELGVKMYLNAEVCAAVLYNYGRYENRDEMLKSIMEISQTLHGFEGFSDLYRILEKDIELCTRFYRVFSRTVISKIELVERGGHSRFRISNDKRSRADLLARRYIDSIKTTALNRNYIQDKLNVNAILTDINNLDAYSDYPTVKSLALKLSKELKTYYNTIDDLDLLGFVFHNKRGLTAKGALQLVSSILISTIDAAAKTNAAYENNQVAIGLAKQQNAAIKKAHERNGKTDLNDYIDLRPLYYKPYIQKESEAAAKQLANCLADYTVFSLSLNSTNVLRNQSSDVINNSMITSIKEMLESKLNTATSKRVNGVVQVVYDENSPICRLSEQRFQNGKCKQYDFSNILLERKLENGEIQYGLFYYDSNDKKYKPTSYCTDLIKFNLFNGAINSDEGNAVVYNGMSKMDYLGSAWRGFFTPTTEHNTLEPESVFSGNVADYYFRIPADAPKQFTMSAPMYSASKLFNIPKDVKDDINKRIKNQILNYLFDTKKGKKIHELLKSKEVYLRTSPVAVHETSEWLDSDDFVLHLLSGIETDENSLPILGKRVRIKLPKFKVDALRKVKAKEGSRINVAFRFKLQDERSEDAKLYIMNGEFKNGFLHDAYCVGIDYREENESKWDDEESTIPRMINKIYWKYFTKLSSQESGLNRQVNTNHSIYLQLKNAFLQELTDMAVAANVLFETEDYVVDGKIVGRKIKTTTSLDENGIEIHTPVFKKGITNTNHNGLIQWYHFADKKDDGHGEIYTRDEEGHIKLTGRVFGSDRMILYDYFSKEPVKKRNYAEDKNKNTGLSPLDYFKLFAETGVIEDRLLLFDENGNVTLNDTQEEIITQMISDFISGTLEFGKKQLNENKDIFNEIPLSTNTYTNYIQDDKDSNLLSFYLNYHLVYLMCNDLFEGDTKYYKNVQTFLKRTKQTQGSGVPFGIVDWTKPLNGKPITPIYTALSNTDFEHKYRDQDGKLHVDKIHIDSYQYFKGLTVFNTVLTDRTTLQRICEALQNKDIMKDAALDKNDAERLIYGPLNEDGEHEGGYQDSCINDAQSYITFKEFIRRVAAKGELEKYKPLIDKILDETKELTVNDIKALVQVQKNFYFDHYFNEKANVNEARQIKNAEFVLIPRLLKGTDLEAVCILMDKLGIDQLNTSETSKAAQSYRFTLWDETGHIDQKVLNDIYRTDEEYESELFQTVLGNKEGIQTFNYNFLYTQQETHQHMFDRNKAGIQFLKKIIDNIDEKTAPEHLYELKKEFFRLVSACVKNSYEKLMKRFNVILDENGNIHLDKEGNIPVQITNEDGEVVQNGINYTEFFSALRDELTRLGVDSNIVDYCTPDPTSFKPYATIMPNYMTLVGVKFENVVQSLFNHAITRQTLPGFHAAQVSGMGTMSNDSRLRNLIKHKQTDNKLQYHPKLYKNKTTGEEITEGELNRLVATNIARREDYEDTGKITPYIEIMLPASAFGFNREHYKHLSREEQDAEFLKQLKAVDADVIIGYRIPTEGKQSLALMKVVGFCDDAYGSTIFLPDAWVQQTGADFDIDSVYGITHNLYFDHNHILRKQGYYNKQDFQEKGRYLWYDYIRRNTGEKRFGITQKRFEELKAKKKDKKKQLTPAEKLVLDVEEDEERSFENLPPREKEDIKKLHSDFKKTYGEKLTREQYVEQLVAEMEKLNEWIGKETFRNTARILNYQNSIDRILNLLTGEDRQDLRTQKRELSKEAEAEFQAGLQAYRDEQYNDYLQDAANNGLMSEQQYIDWALANIEEANSESARINRLVDVMRDIIKDPFTWEEHFSRSNFDRITKAIDKFTVGDTKEIRSARSAYSIFSQAEFMEDAMSGAKLKAFSVVRDTLCSECNTMHAMLANNAEIKVAYKRNAYDINKLKERFGENNVEDDKENGLIYITHTMFGWSNDNRNVDSEIITSYSSQTTAHILDAIKSGNVVNVNDFTFQVYKTLVDIGSNYDTAVSFIMLPGITRLNRMYNLTNSIFSKERGKNYVLKTVRGIFEELGVDYEYTDTLEMMLENINKSYESEIKTVFGKHFKFSVQDYDNASYALNSDTHYDRLKEEGLFESPVYDENGKLIKGLKDAEVYKLLFDLQTVIMFSKMNNLAQDIRTAAMVMNPDKFGAKQTMYETRDVFRRIVEAIQNNLVPSNDEDSEPIDNFRLQVDGKNILNAVYPGLYDKTTTIDALNYVLTSKDFVEKSKYKTLAAFLKYATATSILINKNLFVTERDSFIDLVENPEDGLRSILPPGRSLDKKVVRNFQNYIINTLVMRGKFLQAPLKYVKGRGFARGFDYINYTPKVPNLDEIKTEFNHEEFARCLGYGASPDFSIRDVHTDAKGKSHFIYKEVVVENINDPTQDEIDDFCKLSAAQKIAFIQSHFRDASVFDAIVAKTFIDDSNYTDVAAQFLSFDEQKIDIEYARVLLYQMFTHRNPLLAITAADLVKYAFFAEGYRMGSNNISKIIPNELLIAGGRLAGTNIVNNVELIMENIDAEIGENREKWIRNFVRSHSNEIGLPSITVKKLKGGKTFEIKRTKNGLIKLPYRTNEMDDLTTLIKYNIISEQTNGNLKTNNFVRLKFDKEDIVYQIDEREINTDEDGNKFAYIFLIPLNKLQKNENDVLSSNLDNNKYLLFESYEEIIEEYINDIIENKIEDFVNNTKLEKLFDNEEVKALLQRTKLFGRDIYESSKEIGSLNSNLKFTSLIKNIEEWYNEKDAKETNLFTINGVLSDYVKGYKKNSGARASVTLQDGRTLELYISRYTNIRLIKKYTGKNIDKEIKSKSDLKYKGYIDRVRYFARKQENDEFPFVPIYKVELISDKVLSEVALANRIRSLSTKADVGAQGANSLYKRSYGNDRPAYYAARELRSMGVPTNTDEIGPYLENTIPIIARYVEKEAIEIERSLRQHIEDPAIGEYLAIDNPRVIELIRNDEAALRKYLKAIADPQKFVDDFGLIKELDLTSEDTITKNYLNIIKDAVERIQNIGMIENAYRNYAELYLDEITDDPVIKKDLISVISGFYRTNRFNATFSDIQETSNPLVQLTLKRFSSRLYSRNMEAKRQVEKFLDKMAEFKELAMQRGEAFDLNDIIDEYGRFVMNCNSQFIADRDNYQRRVREAENKYGTNSVEHLKEKLEYDEWKAKHIEQEYVKEYYDRKNQILRIALYGGDKTNISEEDMKKIGSTTTVPAIPKNLSKYLRLRNELYKLKSKITPAIHDDSLLEQIKNVKEQLENIKEENRESGSDRVNDVLNFYIDEERALNNKYFYRKEKEGFRTLLKGMLRTVRMYEMSEMPKAKYMTNPEYIKAKNWLAQNVIETVDINELPPEAKRMYNEYLNNEREAIGKKEKVLSKEKAFKNIATARTFIYNTYVDSNGMFDPRLVPDDVTEEYKKLLDKKRGFLADKPNSDKLLLNNALPDTVVYTSDFYEKLSGTKTSTAIWRDTVTEINSILGKYYVRTPDGKGKIDFSLFEGKEGLEDAIELKKLYKKLTTIRSKAKIPGRKKFMEKVEFPVNKKQYLEDVRTIERTFGTKSALGNALLELIREPRKFRSTKPIDPSKARPLRFLYSYVKPKDAWLDRFTDKKATELKKFQDEYRTRVLREEYDDARINNSINMTEEEYNKWYQRNHTYNPYTGAFEALDYWYKVKWNDKNPNINIKYLPLYSYQERQIKDGAVEKIDDEGNEVRMPDYRNHNYKPNLGHEGNYIKGSNSRYDNNYSISNTEREAMEYIQQTLMLLANVDSAKRYFERGYLPARRKGEGLNSKNWYKELGKVIGWDYEKYDTDDWYSDISYSKHQDLLMPMLSRLEGKISDEKRTREKIYISRQKNNESDTEYEARIKNKYGKTIEEIRKENEEINEMNKEVHKELLDRDWENVIADFIIKAGTYNAIEESKYELFYTKKMLEKYGPYVQGYNRKGQIIFKRDRRNTSEEETQLLRERDDLLIGQLNNQLRRILYNQWKAPNNPKLLRWMSTLQSLSSASFMMFNFKGGVANVTLGETQMMGEAAAATFFGWTIMNRAKARYISKLPDYIAHANDDYSTSLEGAVIKHFDVIDFDEHNGVSRLTRNAKEYLRRIRDYGYLPQTSGEHEMQNTALFAMLESHRLVRNERHETFGEPMYKFMNLQEFTFDLHEKSLKEILNERELERYETFKEEMKNDPMSLKKIAWFQQDTATEFARLFLSREQFKEFRKRKEENEKAAKKEFENDELHPTIWSQLKLSDKGRLTFNKTDDSRGWLGKIDKPKEDGSPSDAYRLLGDFKGRVVSVNKYIHGVYTKLGRAQIENTVLGGLIMQYHKHIPIGIMKRYRLQGMYSEERGAVTKGVLGSLITLCKLPVKDVEVDLNLTKEQAEALRGIQNIFRGILELALHFKLYYGILPEYDKANLRRQLGDAIGVTASICLAMGVRLAMDNDDEDSVLANFCLYEADRLGTEAMEYFPIAMPYNAKKVIQSPIAANSIITDLLGTCGQISKFILNFGDYDMTYQSGKLAGENKVEVYLTRRIPIWRGIKTSFLDIVDNNHYYKLNQNMLGFFDVEKRTTQIKQAWS